MEKAPVNTVVIRSMKRSSRGSISTPPDEPENGSWFSVEAVYDRGHNYRHCAAPRRTRETPSPTDTRPSGNRRTGTAFRSPEEDKYLSIMPSSEPATSH